LMAEILKHRLTTKRTNNYQIVNIQLLSTPIL